MNRRKTRVLFAILLIAHFAAQRFATPIVAWYSNWQHQIRHAVEHAYASHLPQARRPG